MVEICYYCGEDLEGGKRGAVCRLELKEGKELLFCSGDCKQNYEGETEE